MSARPLALAVDGKPPIASIYHWLYSFSYALGFRLGAPPPGTGADDDVTSKIADWLLDPSGLTPHGFCLLWEPWLV